MVMSPEMTPEEEKLTIRDIATAAESQTKQGDTFFLITQRWWQEWLEFVNQNQSTVANEGSSSEHHDLVGSSISRRPSNIDNSDLIYNATSENSTMDIELHDNLVEGSDYILLPQEVWNRLHAWYGGGPALARKVINSSLSQAELSVEVYPLCLQLHLMPKGDKSAIRISKKETIGELHRRACDIFALNSDHVCIWDYFSHQKHALMNDMDKTIDDASIQVDQDILVEVINQNGGCTNSVQENGFEENESLVFAEPSKLSFPVAGASKGLSTNDNSEPSHFQNSTSPIRESDTTPGVSGVVTRGSSGGLTGLLNLGNTCFMNSAIQCLVHTPELARYFREDYHHEINWHNPLGMAGELAIAFGELLRKLWAPGRTPFAPRQFKAKLARFAPQFSGHNQHDSQELLAFLLDGLHEDLNRVKHKPYMKSSDADDRPDEEVADEYWVNHITRNDSIIVDVCQGQYKSTLVCPVCNKFSVTFDPFMYLSLPLQLTTGRTMTVTIFTCDGSALPASCTVNVPKQGLCRDLIQALGGACSINHSEKLLLAEIRNHLIYRLLDDPLMSLSFIRDDDHIAAYKIPKIAGSTKFLRLIHRRGEREVNSRSSMEWKPYGTPLVLPISSDDVITRGDIQLAVQTMLSPMRRGNPLDSDISDNNTATAASTLPDGISAKEVCTDSSNGKKRTLPKLPLQLIDENNVYIDLSVGEEKTVKLSSSLMSMLMFLDWSPKLLKNYNTHYLENLPEVSKNGPVTKRARTEPLSLYTCLEAFLREEPLVPEDMWFCPQCQEQRQASKKLDLWRLPEVLVIHLKRFSYSRSMKHKLETFVKFPIHDFDLTNYIVNKQNSQRHLYQLYALTNHYGNMGSGHYTANIKLLEENKWYNFDDNHISAISEEEVKSGAAYVLFYKRIKNDVAPVSNGAHFSSHR